ncbi:MAG: trypsin-like peptidase domain-containing protein [Candidatus Magasanikbacteria bacterium]|jgi:V8-like Glu-specific endopeptidase|nr:trypsin-like peptidase domain-containing protein [Candidatus Magasanikbacteria bacterium]MBT7754614.1 trypsin-like peptidase domain-containing protein [Candidatus Magasanikbacteria bacterium]
MYAGLWAKTCQSVCSIGHWKDGEKIASGTGFIVDGYLVTNNHVYFCPPSDTVIVEFVEIDGSTSRFRKEFTKDEFVSALKDGSPESNWDFAIIEIEDLKDFPSLELQINNVDFPIGMQVGMLGYAFSQGNLSMHAGMVSSHYSKNSVRYIQIDASVNQGNSGGPLLDVSTGKVIGIVTRAAKGLSEFFDELIESFDQNIRHLSRFKGSIRMGGVDHFQAMKTTQAQMQVISKEIKRSANVGIGYAFSLDEINRFFKK